MEKLFFQQFQINFTTFDDDGDDDDDEVKEKRLKGKKQLLNYFLQLFPCIQSQCSICI